MKKLLFIPFIIASFISFQSCETIGGSRELVKFEDFRMPSDSTFEFTFDNQDPNQLYDIVLMFRYIDGFQFPQMVFNVEYKADSVEPISSVLGLQIIDKDKKYIGDGSGDYWDIEKTLFSSRKLVKGKSVITLKSAMPYENIPYVSTIGIKYVRK